MRCTVCVLAFQVVLFGQVHRDRIIDPQGQPVPYLRVDVGRSSVYTNEEGRFPSDSKERVVVPSETGFGEPGLILRGRRTLRGRISTEYPDVLVIHLDLVRPQGLWRRRYVESVRKLRIRSGEEFEIVSLRPALYRLRVESRRHQWRIREINLVGADAKISLQLGLGVVVSGTVRFDLPNMRAAPSKAIVVGGGRTAEVRSDGSFEFPGFYAGDRAFHVCWSEPGAPSEPLLHSRRFEARIVTPRTQLDFVVRPAPPIRIRFRLPDGSQSASATFEVRRNWGPPVPREPLRLLLERASDGGTTVAIVSDRWGRRREDLERRPELVLDWLQPGKARLVTTAPGFEAHAPLVEIRGGVDFEIRLSSVPGRRVVFEGRSGTVTDGCGLKLTPQSPLGFLRAGRRSHRLLFISDRYLPQQRIVRVAESDEALRVRFDEELAPVVRGRVRTADGIVSSGHRITVAPAEWIGVSSWSGRGGPPMERWKDVVSDESGFRIGGLPPGKYGVTVDGVRLADFEIDSEDKSLDLRLPR